MSPPPTYRPASTDEDLERVPLKSRHSFDEEADPAPSYPPVSAGPSRTNGQNMLYTFEPRYPIEGDSEDALGVLGADREATTAIVQKCFKTLRDFPPERITFLAPVDESTDRKTVHKWGMVMDEAWDGFATNPPSKLKIQVADGPGDAAARHRHHCQIGWVIFVMVVLLFAATFGLVSLLTRDQ